MPEHGTHVPSVAVMVAMPSVSPVALAATVKHSDNDDDVRVDAKEQTNTGIREAARAAHSGE